MSEETKQYVNDIREELSGIPAEEAERIRNFVIGAAAMVKHEAKEGKDNVRESE